MFHLRWLATPDESGPSRRNIQTSLLKRSPSRSESLSNFLTFPISHRFHGPWICFNSFECRRLDLNYSSFDFFSFYDVTSLFSGLYSARNRLKAKNNDNSYNIFLTDTRLRRSAESLSGPKADHLLMTSALLKELRYLNPEKHLSSVW